MALPKLNDVPKYNITIPSTGVKTKFRPFLVKEEKILLLAMESEDKNNMLSSIADTIEACVDDVKINELTSYDLEYIFTKIRAKSVGESVNVLLKCSKCQHENEVSLKLEDVSVSKKTKESTKKINLNDEIVLEMKYPSYQEIVNIDDSAKSQTDQLFDVIRLCMKTLYTNDERISLQDESPQEINEFIESMSSVQLKKITEFIDDMPKVELDVKFNCVSCNEKNELKLDRFEDFFG